MFNYRATYKKVVEGFDRCMGTSELRSFHCPIKSIRTIQEVDNVPVVQISNMYGYINGIYGFKSIYVNDLTGAYYEDIKIIKDGSVRELHNIGLTPFRCSLMTCLAISKFNRAFSSVGFIGNGRINLQNCKAITEIFGHKDVVIRDSAGNRDKNVSEFEKICGKVTIDDTADLQYINQCDIVVVCTSSYKKEDMISTAQLSKPSLIIALDCGYFLDESFRIECNNYTDYVEQINAYYDEEFPYDSVRYSMMQLSNECRYSNGRSVVYLHGIGIADIIVANEIIKTRREDDDSWQKASLQELRLG